MTDLKYDFSKKVAVITGGANGIGAAVANQLRAAGAQIAIWDMQQGSASHDEFFEVDVTNNIQILAATKQLIERYGKIDFLINSAGLTGPTMPLAEYDIEQWQHIVNVNLVGAFRVCRAIIPIMQQHNDGRIVNIASLAGKEGTANASAYSASKAGLIAMTKSLGKELAMTPIRVNSIAPAAVNTELLQQMSPEHVQTMIDKSPMQRLGEIEEVSDMVMWLCSSACSFNSGAVFDLSGGRATY
ncbi:MAG: NAD(P)-dependent dehydrogenase (short-subunit alcohol dehydrogenase family) [Oceanospirillaceae bacterium]|jgi:NAD(P)-dependent dehydrogenase (short-subunit alcohol dehydrogenase family)